jgi:hypothetical protein
MPGSQAPRSFFTRKRLIAGAVLLVLMAAVAGLVFGVFEGDSTGALKVSFVRFEKSEDGKGTLAWLLVTNQTKSDYYVWVERLAPESSFCMIIPSSSTGTLAPKWPIEPMPFGLQRKLDGFLAFRFGVHLPEDGQKGYVALNCERLPKKLTRILSEAHKLMRIVYDPPQRPVWVLSDEEIQCPKRLPDGTVEPPRLLPVAERQR